MFSGGGLVVEKREGTQRLGDGFAVTIGTVHELHGSTTPTTPKTLDYAPERSTEANVALEMACRALLPHASASLPSLLVICGGLNSKGASSGPANRCCRRVMIDVGRS